MNNTVQVTIVANENLRQMLVAELSANGYDAFEEKENSLEAFITETNFDEKILQSLLRPYQVAFDKKIIKEENWNKLWESNFQPVQVDDFCAIRAAFHEPIKNVEHEIIITPKMSFGTGHHATTYMMISQMKDLHFSEQSVADFGTGTGILAILAEKLGARNVYAVDNDNWSIENAHENISCNGCNKIHLAKADCFAPGQKFDIILANINRNVILDNVMNIANAMHGDSKLLLSGLLAEDETAIVIAFNRYDIIKLNILQKEQWISILMECKNISA